jgi:methenyltetrahydrofolate cyclohydrolase
MQPVVFNSLTSKPLEQFLDDLSSSEPVPGGGSVAALSGILSASLLAMVCRLTIGKKGYESVQAEMESLLHLVLPLEPELRALMQSDIDAYARVLETYKLPKNTEAEKATRATEIQNALKQASDVPLRVAEICGQLLERGLPIASKGNKNATSDAGVSALMAEAGLRGAALNVLTNLGMIRDQAFVAAHRTRVTELVEQASKQKHAILAIVEGKM